MDKKLSVINNVIYVLAIIGSFFIWISSFNQCPPGEDYSNCSNYASLYADFTNWSQIGVGIAGFLFSTLLWALIDSFDKYVNRKNK